MRKTSLVLIVEWDPDEYDHPLVWNWSELVGSPVETVGWAGLDMELPES